MAKRTFDHIKKIPNAEPLVDLKDTDSEVMTGVLCSLTHCSTIPTDPDAWERYLADARHIIKKESKNLNALGISTLISALIAENSKG